MKKSLFASLLALSAIGSWAQNSAKDSICVFDGTVTGVPDGTVVYLKLPLPEHNGVYKRDTITTVTGGKFHFEKVIPAGDDCFVGVGKYGYLVNVKLNPGMKTIITGNGMDSDEWIAENEHPDQKEANIYKKYKKEKLADYLALGAQIHAAEAKMYEAQYDAKNEKEAKAAVEDAKRISKLQKALLPKYCAVMSEFMKKRDFSPSYEKELVMITQDAYFADDEEVMNICRELFAKVPKDYESQDVYYTKKYLYPDFKPLKAGDKAKDYTLNDHDGKPHSILETLGNGKYLLLETARKACTGAILDRPKEVLKELHNKYADKFDVVTLAISPKEMFDNKEFPREDWLELGLNETSPFEEIQGTYFPKEERFIFISPEGKILAKCGSDKLNEELKKNFPFIQ
ncbi:MAG: hypothetical protein II900_08210 [Prevotella sp.]|nr:hypothetical protein [Prevotella sp.]